MTLDLKPTQIHILQHLATNSRIQEKELALTLGISRQLVRYHIAKLQQQKIILAFRTTIFMQKLGYRYYNLLLKAETNTTILDKIHDHWSNQADTYWVGGTFGTYDTLISLRVKTFDDVENHMNTFLHTFHTTKITHEIYEIILIYKNSITSFFETNKQQKIHSLHTLKKISTEHYLLTESERAILNIIAANARISLREIARTTKRSVSFTSTALKKLEKNNVIRQYTITFNFTKYNITRCKLFIKFHALNQPLELRFYEFICQSKLIVYADKILGTYDVTCNIIFREVTELQKELKDIKDLFGEHITQTLLILISDTHKVKSKI